MRENEGKMRTRITPNTNSFYSVQMLQILSVELERSLENLIEGPQSSKTFPTGVAALP